VAQTDETADEVVPMQRPLLDQRGVDRYVEILSKIEQGTAGEELTVEE